MIWWISYDIAAPKRLRRVAKLCRSAGLRQSQKSIYVGELSQERIFRLREEILQELHPEEDKVLMFPMPEQCLRSAVSLGIDSGLSELLEKKEIIFI